LARIRPDVTYPSGAEVLGDAPFPLGPPNASVIKEALSRLNPVSVSIRKLILDSRGVGPKIIFATDGDLVLNEDEARRRFVSRRGMGHCSFLSLVQPIHVDTADGVHFPLSQAPPTHAGKPDSDLSLLLIMAVFAFGA
jgi:hypothetical protein